MFLAAQMTRTTVGISLRNLMQMEWSVSGCRDRLGGMVSHKLSWHCKTARLTQLACWKLLRGERFQWS